MEFGTKDRMFVVDAITKSLKYGWNEQDSMELLQFHNTFEVYEQVYEYTLIGSRLDDP